MYSSQHPPLSYAQKVKRSNQVQPVRLDGMSATQFIDLLKSFGLSVGTPASNTDKESREVPQAEHSHTPAPQTHTAASPARETSDGFTQVGRAGKPVGTKRGGPQAKTSGAPSAVPSPSTPCPPTPDRPTGDDATLSHPLVSRSEQAMGPPPPPPPPPSLRHSAVAAAPSPDAASRSRQESPSSQRRPSSSPSPSPVGGRGDKRPLRESVSPLERDSAHRPRARVEAPARKAPDRSPSASPARSGAAQFF